MTPPRGRCTVFIQSWFKNNLDAQFRPRPSRALHWRPRGPNAPGTPFTAWRLLEHLRLAQWDILEFSRNPQHVSPKWPEGYWPEGDAPPPRADNAAWRKSVEGFRADLKAMQNLVENPGTDLFAAIPGGDGQTILREALLVADHNAYHLGQLVMLRRQLGAWPEP